MKAVVAKSRFRTTRASPLLLFRALSASAPVRARFTSLLLFPLILLPVMLLLLRLGIIELETVSFI